VSLSPEVIQQFSVGLISLHDALAQGTQNQESQQSERNLTQQEQLFFPRQKFFELNLPKMQTGGMVGMDLFEEGDQDVNEALNMMATATNPDVPDMPATNGATVVEKTVTEDQGPVDVDKEPFRQMAVEIVKEAVMSLVREDYMNIEPVQQEVEQQLTAIDESYRQQTNSTDTILTEEFLAKLDNLMINASSEMDNVPGMEEGGVADGYDINTMIESMSGQGVDPVKIQEIIEKYYNTESMGVSREMLQERIKKARRAALLSGKTKQGGVSGLMDVLGQADAAEVEAINTMPETLASNEGALQQIAMRGELETIGAGSGGGGLTADAKKIMMMQSIYADPKMPQAMKDILLKGLANLKPGAEQKLTLMNSFIDSLPDDPRKRQKIVGTKVNPTPAEIAKWASEMADAMLTQISGSKPKKTREG